ncbi:MAG: glycoside hydrolase family 43 protein [Clostridia bacterium]|nr:glycoside hydrolase family 43 protein [Clostridia bacterium]
MPDFIIRNPILPGFNPDPSIVRAGDDFYIATSSFSYFPGIPIYHSRDLVHWELLNYAFTDPDTLPLPPGNISGGLFAPTLRLHDGLFYLIVTNMSAMQTYLVTAKDPAGEWSKPIILPVAFDPDLFWDDDGTLYVSGCMFGDPSPGAPRIGFYKVDTERWTYDGEQHGLWTGALYGASWPEAPHIFKKDGWYYLLIAEGGTEYYHAVTVARSRSVGGPYEGYEGNPILTHRHMGMSAPICNVGHADLVELKDGSWYTVFLGSRPYGNHNKNLGRETFIAPVIWEDGWPVVSPESGKCEFTYPAPDLEPHPFHAAPSRDEFKGDSLALEWNTLGTPTNRPYHLTKDGLHVRAVGKKIRYGASPAAIGFVGRRQQHMSFTATARMTFAPEAGQSAGLMILQHDYASMRIEAAPGELRVLSNVVATRPNYEPSTSEETVLASTPWNGEPVVLSIRAKGQSHSFWYGSDEDSMKPLFEGLDGGFLGSDVCGGFVGAYVGTFCSGDEESENEAVFGWFEYLPEK